MDKEALHDHIADILERIAHLNKNLAGTNKVLPVEIDLLKGYMAELDKSFEALIYKEVTDEKTSVNNDAKNIEVEEAPKVEAAPVVDEDELPTQAAFKEEVGEEPAMETVEVGHEEPTEETEAEVATPEEIEEEAEPVTPTIIEEEIVEEQKPAIAEPAFEFVEEQKEKEVPVAGEESAIEQVEEPIEEPVFEPGPAIEVGKTQHQLYQDEEEDEEKEAEQPVAKGAASLNERFSKREGAELGYKIKAPMLSLKAMIDLSEKYVYTKELFGGDKDHFESTLKYLDQCNNLTEANAHLNNVVKPRFKWDDKVEVEKRFRGLLAQRFN